MKIRKSNSRNGHMLDLVLADMFIAINGALISNFFRTHNN